MVSGKDCKDKIAGIFELVQEWTLKQIFFFFLIPPQGSSDSDGEADEGVTAKSFLKKKPEPAPDASKFLKSAKGSGVKSRDNI